MEIRRTFTKSEMTQLTYAICRVKDVAESEDKNHACKMEHEQLAEWLQELKEYRDFFNMLNSNFIAYDGGYVQDVKPLAGFTADNAKDYKDQTSYLKAVTSEVYKTQNILEFLQKYPKVASMLGKIVVFTSNKGKTIIGKLLLHNGVYPCLYIRPFTKAGKISKIVSYLGYPSSTFDLDSLELWEG